MTEPLGVRTSIWPNSPSSSNTRGIANKIKPLSADAASRITASKQITSLTEVVLGLLENSLDAGASKIDLSVNLHRGSCTVEDNGCGVPAGEFKANGGLCKSRHTSKQGPHRPPAVHSAEGIFLASLSALCLLNIDSQPGDQTDSASVVIHQGKVLARQVPSTASCEPLPYPPRGTRVIVNDLFGNMPVRIKQRALTSEVAHSIEKLWQGLKHDVVALLLAWESPCSLKVRNCLQASRSYNLSTRHPTYSHALTKRNLSNLNSTQTTFSLIDKLPVIFQAALAPHESRQQWVPTSASTPSFSIKGFICLVPAATKSCQFISLGVHPCAVHAGYENIYERLNKLFAESSFGVVEDASDPGPNLKTRDGYTKRQLHRRKGIDRWPMFVFCISLKEGQQYASSNLVPTANVVLDSCSDVMALMITQWLSAHDFRPRSIRKEKPHVSNRPTAASTVNLEPTLTDSQQSSTIKGPIVRPSRPRDTEMTTTVASDDLSQHLNNRWTRVRRGDRLICGKLELNRPSTAPAMRGCGNDTYTHLAIDDASGPHQRKRRASLDVLSSEYSEDINDVEMWEAAAVWDTALGDHSSNQRGERVAEPERKPSPEKRNLPLPPVAHVLNIGRLNNANRNHASIQTRSIRLARRNPSTVDPGGSHGLPNVLKNWQNPIFASRDKEVIPSLTPASLEASAAISPTSGNQHSGIAISLGKSTKLSRNNIVHGRVIGQVDAKFILCLVPSSTLECHSNSLVLVDQHAASERVILEQLVADLCLPMVSTRVETDFWTNTNCKSAIATTLFEKSITFEVSHAELNLFATHAADFARWGILYDLSAIDPLAGASQVRAPPRQHRISVRALPPGIAERCRLVPQVLIDLLRSEVWRMADSLHTRSQLSTVSERGVNADQEGDGSWLSRIGSCPKAILDLLNARACRSAIMFNDPLSKEECAQLLADLSKTTFPFMCAHGRASAVPLVEIGADSAVMNEKLNADCVSGFAAQENVRQLRGFGTSYRRWRQSA